MSERDTGGPAFPTLAGDLGWDTPGMTMLDYAAVEIVAKNCYQWNDEHGMDREDCARDAYRLAEAVVAEKRRQEK